MPYYATFAILGLAVLLHELGHYGAMRLSGVPVEQFSVGFGPSLISRRFAGTRWSLRLLFLGGYVKPDAERMEAAPWPRRVAIALAGPAANLLTAAIALGIMGGLATSLVGGLVIFGHYPEILWAMLSDTVAGLWHVLGGHVGSMSGVVGMARENSSLPADAKDLTPASLYLIVYCITSTGLGIFNLLPVPMLDGGRAIMAAAESLVGRERMKRLEPHLIGWSLIPLGILFVAVNVHDVVKAL